MKPRMIAFGYSRECNVRCGHCIVEDASPRETRMPLDVAEKIIGELALAGVGGISFTVGEPLLRYDDLRKLVNRSSGLGLFTRVVTSACWASSADQADRIVVGLRECGLSQLRISCSRWHQARIPLENVANAAAASDRNGLNYFVSFLTDFSPGDRRLESFLQERRLRTFTDPLLYFGAAARFRRPHARGKTSPNRCALDPLLGPSLEMFACCGPGNLFRNTGFFRVGSLHEDSVPELFHRMDTHPLYRLVRSEGLTSLAGSLGLSAEEIAKVEKCELCEMLFDSSENVRKLERLARA